MKRNETQNIAALCRVANVLTVWSIKMEAKLWGIMCTIDLLSTRCSRTPLPAAHQCRFCLGNCSTHQDGELTWNKAAVDGILAFGPQALSIVSQLSSQGIAPKAFSHCFRGDGVGGGILVLGQILEPSIIYTPLDPSQSHYTLNMQSIAVNGQSLPIDPAVLSTSTDQGTIVDTGTTLVYLVPEAYQPFLNAITAAVTGLATPLQSLDNFCYHVLVIARMALRGAWASRRLKIDSLF
ncbi:Xylanase inhibitor, N-terminal [Dillenia turbinata]|uniref:Xylanase inhibitor, N-terminal n=1 Tax=Dillenia turbinata TaxID=194707 RepID=A0AAN8YWR0_9MAGN